MGKILQRCDVCKNFHVAFVVKDHETGIKTYLCSSCWKKRYSSPESEKRPQQTAAKLHEKVAPPMTPTLERKPYPILEFDPTPEAIIEPKRYIQPRPVPVHCVISFFREVLDKVIAENQAKIIVKNQWEDGPHPLYEINSQGERIALFHPGVGGAIAANLLEEVIAFGCRKFMVCGGCGVLEKNTPVGHLFVVSSAIRDEGVSYHYLPPAREVKANPAGVKALEKILQQHHVPYQTGKTWTTDAPYRETLSKIEARRAEGCLTVEMEAASLMAVAEFRGATLGQVLYAGDDLSGSEWDERDWQNRKDIREKLFWLAVEACLEL